MFKSVAKYSLINLVLIIAFFCVSQNTLAQQYACLPTCSTIDAKFLVLSGTELFSLNNDRISFGIRSPGDSPFVELGIFDGDQGMSWETPSAGADLEFTLFADPNNDGTGNVVVNQWFGDTMPDDDWFVINQVNSAQAVSENGDYIYKLTVRNLNPNVLSSNSFKLRTDGRIKVLPFEIFSFISAIGDPDDLFIVYPNFGECVELCDPVDPDCCLHETTYDGDWCFNFIMPEDVERVEMFDGDFDYGTSVENEGGSACIPDGVLVDADDANTPNDILFPWTIGTDVVFEGATIGSPADDNCFLPQIRPPSITYSLVGPQGSNLVNDNPSGTSEWERFSITTGALDPMVDDLSTPSFEPGQWLIKVFGLDQSNLNVIRFPYAINGEDENGDPVPFDPEDPTEIPTLNEWGLIALTSILLAMSVYYLRRKRVIN